METAAYYLALLTLLAAPYIFVYWFLLHPFARQWRRRGPAVTFLVVHSVMLLLAAGLFRFREPLLRSHFGVDLPQVAVGVVLFLASSYMGFRRARYLTLPIMAGVPELSPDNPGKLITEGIYSQLRNPRYVEGFLGLGAVALYTNYLVVYLMWSAYVPAFFLIVRLEERELRQRFGERYEEYCRQVPRFVPRFR